ncbi:MAG TPA: hypothetical protein VEF76_10660 [Patescibacteria group bacterium]|nr:hypothetical protein [Patescibacteria group bacterium]
MWRKKTDKRITAAGIAIAAAIIAYGAWKDLHPLLQPQVKAASFTSYKMLHDVKDPAALAKDQTSSFIFPIGEIKGDDGVFVPSSLKPVSLPQQETVLLLTLDKVPSHFSPVYDSLREPVKAWSRSGSLVNDVFIDYSENPPDLDRIGPFTSGLRAYLQRQYWIILGVRRTALPFSQENRTKLANMLKGIEFIVYRMEDVEKTGETLGQTITRIDKEGLPFLLRVKALPDYDALKKELPEGKQNFSGFVLGQQPSDKTE